MAYEPLFRLASGGMAEVWVARHRGPGGFVRPVAYKRLHEHLRDEDRYVAMAMDEMRVMGLVQHPNVVTLFDVGVEEDGTPFIVMELVLGASLQDLLVATRRPLPIGATVAIVAEVAEGLHGAFHTRTPTGKPLRLVHRDVSPQNILIGLDGRARVTDFGVAKFEGRTDKTGTGVARGKVAYMAPEQLRSETVDHRSDLFALAAVTWEALTHERLFRGETPLATIHNILERPIPPLHEVRPDLPASLAEVVERGLSREREERFGSGRAFAAALRGAADDAGHPALEPDVLCELVRQYGGEKLVERVRRVEEAFDGTTTSVFIGPDGRPIEPPRGTEPSTMPEPIDPVDPVDDLGAPDPTEVDLPHPNAGRRVPLWGIFVATMVVSGLVAWGVLRWTRVAPSPTTEASPAVVTEEAPPREEAVPMDTMETMETAPTTLTRAEDEPEVAAPSMISSPPVGRTATRRSRPTAPPAPTTPHPAAEPAEPAPERAAPSKSARAVGQW